jgi:hypothetical protein
MSASDVAASAGEPREPNPEAVAWYVEEAQRLLEDQQRRVESLRTRGGQVAGFGAAVLALIGGNAITLLDIFDRSIRTVAGAALVSSAFCLAAAVAIAIWGVLRPGAYAAISAEETTNYTRARFLAEPELWRVHVRSLHALDYATASAQEAGDSAAKAVERRRRWKEAACGASLGQCGVESPVEAVAQALSLSG